MFKKGNRRMWMVLVGIYGLIKGAREVIKKKAVQRSGVMEVLFLYTFLSFLFVAPDAGNAMGLTAGQMGLVFIKSAVIFLAWICGFVAIARMPVSLYGVVDLARMLFSTLFGILLLHERLTPQVAVGFCLVLGGLVMLRRPWRKTAEPGERTALPILLAALASCLLNAVSGTMDKVLMRGMNSSQLQFWYMLFLCAMYGAYLLLSRTKVDWKGALKNGWIWLLSLLFVIGDRALFLANGMADSRVTVMTLIKQSGVLFAILGGWLVFREKHIGYRLLCALVVVSGIVVAVL